MAEEFFGKILKQMYAYQKEHNTVRQCITNSQYFVDCIKGNGYWAKTAPVFAITEEGTSAGVSVHMIVLVLDSTTNDVDIIDPSYQYMTKTMHYCKTYNELMQLMKGRKCNLKNLLAEFLQFVETAKRQNEGEMVVADKDYYNAQADYVEGKIGYLI